MSGISIESDHRRLLVHDKGMSVNMIFVSNAKLLKNLDLRKKNEESWFGEDYFGNKKVR